MFEHQVEELTLIPSKGGAFEVVVDDELLHSKKATKQHIAPDAVLKTIRELRASA